MQPFNPPQLSATFNFLPLPVFQAAVNEAQNNTQAPLGLILVTALTPLSIAIQGTTDVLTPIDRQVPTSTNTATSAKSGERKSTIENILMRSIRKIEDEQRQIFEDELRAYVAKLDIWKTKRKGLQRAISVKIGKQEDVSSEEAELHELLLAEPKPPRKFKMLYEDSTSQALYPGLHGQFPSAGLISTEGSTILNGSAMNDLAKANAIWSGETITVDRASSESYTLADARLTISIMIQPDLLTKYMTEDRGKLARGAGLLARFLVCTPGSTQGTRFITNGTVSWDHCDAFNARVAELVQENIDAVRSGNTTRQVVKFSPEAAARWLDVYNWIESQIAPGGQYADAGDHASKLPENIARVAALLHRFEGFPGDISPATLEAAYHICYACSYDFMQTFVAPPVQPQEAQDATLLDAWLQAYRNVGHRALEKNRVRQGGPNALRDRVRLNRAIETLCQWGRIRVTRVGRTQVLDLFPGMHGF